MSDNDKSNELQPPVYDDDEAGVIEIPFQSLSKQALEGIIEEFTSRDGTDYGDIECSQAEKVAQVIGQLNKGELTLLFDPIEQNCHIIHSRDWKSTL